MENGATNTLWEDVMARQLADQWAVLKRCLQEAKNSWGTKGVNFIIADDIKRGNHEQ